MPTLKLGSTTAMTESGGTITLDSGINGTQFKSSTLVAGDVLRMYHSAKGSGVDYSSSTSQTLTMTGAAFTMETPQFDTTAETSTIWKITGSCHVDSTTANGSCSIATWVTYDANAGTPTWTRIATAGADSGEGRYISYEADPDVYQTVMVVHYVTLTASRPYTKIGFAWYGYEGSDTNRWNHTTGSGAYAEAVQIKI